MIQIVLIIVTVTLAVGLFGVFVWLNVAALRSGRPVSRLGAAYTAWAEETQRTQRLDERSPTDDA